MGTRAPIVKSLAATVMILAAGTADAQQGTIVRAKDGDTILIDGDDRVRVIRRHSAIIRTVFNAEQRWLVVLADYPDRTGATDGRVDTSMHFKDIGGNWPIEPRWEGQGFVEEYATATGPRAGIGLRLPQGLIQLVSPMPPTAPSQFEDASALAVLPHKGSGSSGSGLSGSGRLSFDEAEQREIANIMGRSEGPPSPSVGITSSVEFRAGAAAAGPQPVRVGGTIPTPAKIHHVDPVPPELARQARVRGVVIVEAIIDVDGSVKQARVLRSIPLLDEAALEAVRQWRFEPTQLNGQPVPVIMTLTVNFQ